MSMLKTTCENCGEIELPVDRVLLRIDQQSPAGVCVIRCPHCRRRFLKEADQFMVALLLAVGIEVSVWSSHLSDESGHGSREPISQAELTEFSQHLSVDRDILSDLSAG